MEIKPEIMVIEDEKAISDFLTAKLETANYRTLAVYTGKEAISLAASHCPDLILLDLGLSDIDGMDVLASLRSWSSVPIIIVSARHKDDDIVQALDKGADDYIVKPFNNSVLMARVRTALRQRGYTAAGTASNIQTFDAGRLCIDYDKLLVTLEGQKIHLTPIEYKVFALLAKNAGRVVMYDTIRKVLWGPYSGDNSTLLRVNMANLRRKIEENSADPKYIQTEMGVGYRMMESDENFFPEHSAT